jgi:hypothetical protein
MGRTGNIVEMRRKDEEKGWKGEEKVKEMKRKERKRRREKVEEGKENGKRKGKKKGTVEERKGMGEERKLCWRRKRKKRKNWENWEGKRKEEIREVSVGLVE